MPRNTLTSQDITALRALVLASPDTAAMRAEGNDGGIRDWLNAPSATSAWRNTPAGAVFAAVDMAEMDNLSAEGKRWAIGTVMPQKGGIDATTASGRKAITDLFPNTGTPLSRAAVLVAAQELATRAQATIGGSNASSASPNVVTALVRDYDGRVSEEEVIAMRGAGW